MKLVRVSTPSVYAKEPPLVLLHGLFGAPESFRELVSILKYPGPVLAPVLPGHGPDPEPVASFDATLAALAAELPRRCHVLGYSLGGRLALGLAARHADTCLRVVAVGAHPGIADPREREERQRWDASQAESLAREGLATFLVSWAELPLFASQASLPRAKQGEQQAIRLSHSERGVAEAFRELGTGSMPDLSGDLARCTTPLCLVHGELDARFASLHRALGARAPAIRVASIRGAGHNPVLEAPAELARLAHEFFRAAPPAPLEKHP